jgi:sortase (surface protein transpeptidase)
MAIRSIRRGGRGRRGAATIAALAAVLLAGCASGGAAVPGVPSGAAIQESPGATAHPISAAALPKSAPLTLRIPAIGVSTGRLVDLGLDAQRALEVPDDAITAGWFTLSPTPGEVGPSVIAGHVNYASVPGVFARLHDMRPGEAIEVDRADGTSAVFTAYQVERYPKSAFPTERVYGNTETPELRLITCGGSFDQAAGEYRDNVVVFATLTSSYQR